MRRQILLSILSCLFLPPVVAAVDVNLTGTAVTYGVLGRGLTWASGINQNFIADTYSSSIGACLTFNNNDSSQHTFALAAFITPDRALTTFTGSTAAWTSVPVTQSPGASGYTVTANGTLQLYVNLPSAARATFAISGGGGAGTVDAFYTLTPTPCGVSPAGTPQVCDRSVVGQAASSSTVILIPAPAAGQFIHVCGGFGSGDVASNGTLTLLSTGTAGTCGALGSTRWQYSPHTGGSNSPFGAGFGQLFQTDVAAQPLCFTNGASGATQFISLSYGVY